MTYEEALKFLDEHCTANVIPFEVKVLCSQALDKQMPKKPILVVDNMFNHYECPVCGEIVWKNNHHCVCGQAILWEWEK